MHISINSVIIKSSSFDIVDICDNVAKKLNRELITELKLYRNPVHLSAVLSSFL